MRTATFLLLLLGAAPEALAADGAEIFTTYCVACHGATGRGDGAAASALPTPPRNFTDPSFWERRSEEQIKAVITNGGAANGLSPLMAGWGPIIGDDGVRSVYAYISTEFRPAAPANPCTPANPCAPPANPCTPNNPCAPPAVK